MEEKTLLEYLYSLGEETTVDVYIYIYINGGYRLVLVNKAKELLWCLSKEMLNTRYYICYPVVVFDDLEIINVCVQELA